MTMRLLLTGAGGFVAGSILRQALDGWEVVALSRGAARLLRPGLTWHTADICDAAQTAAAFESFRPHAVIHAAAIADIDYCEAHQEAATRVNVTATRHIAAQCALRGCRLIYLSTDTVFDGERGAYGEEDAPNPLNHYAATKVEAEQVVAGAGCPSVTARVALVMGLPMLGAGNSFLSRMLPVLAQGRELGVPDQEIRSPIDVVTLGRALLELAQSDFTGVLHLAGNDWLNRCAMVRRIAECFGFDPALVKPTNPIHLPGRAPRPRDVSLRNDRARAVLRTPMQDLDGGIALILETRDRSQYISQ